MIDIMRTGSGASDTPSSEERTDSGIEIPEVAGPEHVRDGLGERLGRPGEFPFTRGVRSGMYRERPWTIRQLAGYGTARQTNERYRMLLEQGANGVNGVFDYPSLRAFDSDDPRARSDVGRGGVAVDVPSDFENLFDAIPLDRVSVSLVSSQPIGAAPHLAMFLRAARARGFAPEQLAGTSQNDFLMETAITIAPAALPPQASFRVACDVVEFALRELPRWNPISVAGYNYREAGADAPLEMALTLTHGQAVVRELVRRGWSPEEILPRVTFFLCADSDFFEEIAKFRAIRRLWACWARDELGVQDERALRFRFHVQTSGVSNTARFAHTNIARSALQGLAAVLGGTQSLHVNGYDEAISIPSQHAALTALRTQYVLRDETGVTRSADPLGGSYLVEYLTDAIEERAQALVRTIDSLGGIVAATQDGWVHNALAQNAYKFQQAIETGARSVVGVGEFSEGQDDVVPEPFEIPPGTRETQAKRLAEVRARRDDAVTQRALEGLGGACRSADENLMPTIRQAVDADATLGEIGECLRRELGSWTFPL